MNDAIAAHLIPVDQAFRDAEAKWGVGQLPTLVSASTLASFRRGFQMWQDAINANAVAKVADLAPKMIQALQIMDREATSAGHATLAVTAWEAATPDGRVFVLCRTSAEAHALAAAPDGRERAIWTVEEIARVLERLETLDAVKRTWPGARVEKLTQRDSSYAQDWVTGDADIFQGEAA